MNSAAIIGLGLLQLTGMNDITVDNNNWLNIGLKDPYVWLAAPQIEQPVKGVLIDYQLSNSPQEYGVEVYYSTNLHSFSEKFKHYFKIKPQSSNRLYVPIDLVNNELLQVFRLDFDQCGGCRVKLNQMTLIGQNELAQVESYRPTDYESKIELKRIITTPEGKQLSVSEPFIWKSLPDSKTNSKAILLEYEITDNPSSYRIDLYYSTNLHLFSKQLKYSFQLPDQEKNILLVPVDLTDREVLRAIMLDMENCPGCRMKLNKVDLLAEDEIAQYQQFIPADYQSHSAVKQKEVSAKGMRISLQDFSLKDLEIVGHNKVKVIGQEPRLDSPPLEVMINEFAGVYLRLKIPQSQQPGMYINLDWNTARYGHRKKVVSKWSGIGQDTAELFFPFNPVSAEQWLRYFWIRLEPQLSDEYTIEEILLVTKENQQEFIDFTPSLANFPGAISSLPGLIKGGIKRMLKDWGFLIVYCLALVSVITVLVLNWLAKLNRASTNKANIDETRL